MPATRDWVKKHYDKQLCGSPEPVPGKCGSKMRGTDPPRYCTRWPKKGRNRCELYPRVEFPVDVSGQA